MRDRTFPPRVLRYSELSRMSESPAHFRAAYEHPREQTPSMRFGSLTHALILGGPTASTIVVWEGERGAKGWKAFKDEHESDFIVTREEHDRASKIAAKVRAHHLAGPMLVGALEEDMQWQRGSLACAGRPDIRGNATITEVKLSACVRPDWFIRHGLKLAYHAQLSWYVNGANLAGHDVFMANIIAVEMREPHSIVCFSLDRDALTEGEKLWTQWVERYSVCVGAQSGGHWPEYADYVVPFTVPKDLELVYGDDEPSEEAA